MRNTHKGPSFFAIHYFLHPIITLSLWLREKGEKEEVEGKGDEEKEEWMMEKQGETGEAGSRGEREKRTENQNKNRILFQWTTTNRDFFSYVYTKNLIPLGNIMHAIMALKNTPNRIWNSVHLDETRISRSTRNHFLNRKGFATTRISRNQMSMHYSILLYSLSLLC